jgi:hypothetical protein
MLLPLRLSTIISFAPEPFFSLSELNYRATIARCVGRP